MGATRWPGRPASIDLARRGRRIRNARRHAAGRPGMRLVQSGDAHFRVREAGSGPGVVVIVPDPPNVIEHYDALIARLAHHSRVVCVEAVGFGFSVPPRRFGFTLDEHVDEFAALLHALGIQEAVLAWPCMAGYIALRLAALRPDLVRGVVCCQTPAWSEELAWARRLDPKGLVTTPYLGQIVFMAARRRIARSWYETSAAPESFPFIASVGAEALRNGAGYPLASTFQSFLGVHGQSSVPLDLPAVFVWGALDRTHRKTDPDSCRTLAREARVVTFEDAGHFPDIESPERFASVVGELVRRT